MKIEKFTKQKDNRYKINFDNEMSIFLYDDVIVKYNLLVNKEMDNKKIKEIIDYNNNLEAYYKSIKYINRKLRCKKEIVKYLKDYNNTVIENTILKLEQDGYLNDKIYLSAYINDQINLTLNGYYKIVKDLINLGFEELEIYEELGKIDKEIWDLRISKLIDKKVKTNHNSSYKKLKEKILNDLSVMGYRKEDIINILESKNIMIDDSIIEKEGNKLYNKLIKKYEGEKLVYYLKNKLLLKGFTIEDINSFIDKKNTE